MKRATSKKKGDTFTEITDVTSAVWPNMEDDSTATMATNVLNTKLSVGAEVWVRRTTHPPFAKRWPGKSQVMMQQKQDIPVAGLYEWLTEDTVPEEHHNNEGHDWPVTSYTPKFPLRFQSGEKCSFWGYSCGTANRSPVHEIQRYYLFTGWFARMFPR